MAGFGSRYKRFLTGAALRVLLCVALYIPGPVAPMPFYFLSTSSLVLVIASHYCFFFFFFHFCLLGLGLM